MEYKILLEEFMKVEITEGRIWKYVEEKENNLTKEEIYSRVTIMLEEEFLRIN
jgi:hypothetical protein